MTIDRSHKRLCLIATLVLFVATALPSDAVASERHDQIKAAFIYNFARFTEWPSDSFDSPSSSVRLCFRSSHPLSRALDTIDRKMVGDRSIELIRLHDGAVEAACHISLLSEADTAQSIPAARGLLTVGDAPHFAENGGVIELIQVGRQIRFQINSTAIDRAHLRMSSKLLRLATDVIQ